MDCRWILQIYLYRCIPVSTSLATTWTAPHSFAAMAEAPHPLPRSRTDIPRHTPGLSKRYLQGGDIKRALTAIPHTHKTIPAFYCEAKRLPWKCLSPGPVYGPVRVTKRPELWSFSPKSAAGGEQSQFDLRSQTLLSRYLCVLWNKPPDVFIWLAAVWETSVYVCLLQ